MSFFPYNLHKNDDKLDTMTHLRNGITRQVCTDLLEYQKLGEGASQHNRKIKVLAGLQNPTERLSTKKFICIPDYFAVEQLAKNSRTADQLIESLCKWSLYNTFLIVAQKQPITATLTHLIGHLLIQI